MTDGESEAFETELDAYRDRVEKPLWRLFRAYGRDEWRWLAVGVATSVFTYGALLVTPIRSLSWQTAKSSSAGDQGGCWRPTGCTRPSGASRPARSRTSQSRSPGRPRVVESADDSFGLENRWT